MVTRTPRVTVIYKTLPQYRIPFFEALRQKLTSEGIELSLIYGQPDKEDAKKKDTGDIPWARKIRNVYIKIGSRHLIWQPCLRLIRGSDLIIVEQASKLILNYYLIFKQVLGGRKIAFWGHGRTIGERVSNRFGEAAKKYLSRKVYWWFAYTQKSADFVAQLGFPRNRITIVQNSIDTESLVNYRNNATKEMINDAIERLKIESVNVAIYVGGLYKGKKLDYLLSAAFEIRARIPDFHLIIIGAGPEQYSIIDQAGHYSWIHYLGPKFGNDRVPFFKIAKVFLLPGCVGLAIIDSFVFETPIITVDSPAHAPEIEYLENGINGIILDQSIGPIEYAKTAADLICDGKLMNNLKEGCRRSANRYTLHEMVVRFSGGTRKAISLKKTNQV